jgi:DNA-binding LacI/PurR family transcriptional regulator
LYNTKPSLRARGTPKDVAKDCGRISFDGFERFNRPNQLSTKLRESVLAAARSIDYSRRNPAARILWIGFAKTIAVVWTDPMAHAFEDQAAVSVLSGVAEACAERGLNTLLLRGGAAAGAVKG